MRVPPPLQPPPPPPPPRVRIKPDLGTSSIPAPFGRSMYDAILSSASTSTSTSTYADNKQQQSPSQSYRHFDRMVVTLEESLDETTKEMSVVISPDSTNNTCSTNTDDDDDNNNNNNNNNKRWTVPFARAIAEPSLLSEACPTISLAEHGWYDNPNNNNNNNNNYNKPRRKKEFVKLGVVAAVYDDDDNDDDSTGRRRILLTRRASHMRSFPHAWVMPGGGVDKEETLVDCCVREVQEETGVAIDPASVQPFAIWESCYPTSGKNCIKAGTGITAHYLAVFCTARAVKEQQQPAVVSLDEQETDLAVWLSQDDFLRTLEHPLGGIDLGSIPSITASLSSSSSSSSSPSNVQQQLLPLEELCGIYPRGDAIKGIAQGHLFMLEELLLLP